MSGTIAQVATRPIRAQPDPRGHSIRSRNAIRRLRGKLRATRLEAYAASAIISGFRLPGAVEETRYMAERSRTRRNTLERRCLPKTFKRMFVGAPKGIFKMLEKVKKA